MLYSKTIRVTLQKVNGLWLNTKYIEGCKDIISFALVEINKIIQNGMQQNAGQEFPCNCNELYYQYLKIFTFLFIVNQNSLCCGRFFFSFCKEWTCEKIPLFHSSTYLLSLTITLEEKFSLSLSLKLSLFHLRLIDICFDWQEVLT